MDNKTFKGATRYKDHTKHVFDVGNVDTWEEAMMALKDQPNVVAALVLVPHSEAVLVPEYA